MGIAVFPAPVRLELMMFQEQLPDTEQSEDTVPALTVVIVGKS